ncbi:hypothetical protein ColKHC_13186 [Colletotrichum higginsianum]|nr:hypothetical protein ColKHC_13186 [Colletotrichum higginsianum]
MDVAWQTATSGRNRPEPDSRTTTTKKILRVKSRAAAKRCREKTKQYETDLANKEKQVAQEREYLDSCVTALKNEVLALRNRVLEHGSCECEMIQRYIVRTASSVAYNGHEVPAMLPSLI